jgi:hypothetical protein
MKPAATCLLIAAIALGNVSPAQAQRNPSRQHDDHPADLSAPLPYRPLVVFPAPYLARNTHADWCLAHRPGYNPYDNTFQGTYGERVHCRSPYGG